MKDVNVTGGAEGGELGSRLGGAAVSSARASVPPPRVKTHQSRVRLVAHLLLVCFVLCYRP